MAFGSSSTLQQDDGVAAVAASGSGAVGGGGTVQSWDAITGKPFTDIGDGLGVSSDALEVAPSDFAGDGLQESGGDLAVDSTVVRTTRTLTGGDGVQAIGDLSADRTVAVDATVARTDRDETFEQNVTFKGDVTTTGDVFETEAETVQVSDSIANLNFKETGAGVTAARGVSGWSIDRGTENPYAFAFHEAGGRFRIGEHWLTLQHNGGTPFSLHEEVVGQSSGASGYVWSDSTGTLQIKNWHGAFDASNGETIEGQSSGATATLTAKTEHDDTQAVATREDSPEPSGVPFWNDTANRFDTDTSFTYDGDRVRSTGYQSDSKFDPGFSGSGYAVDETIDGKPDAMHLSHLDVRGTLTVRELILKQITVEKGPNIISPGGGKVEDISSSSHTAVSNTFDGNTDQQEWSFTDQTDDPLKHGLAVGDRLLAQRFDPDSQTVVVQVRAVVDVVPDPTTVKVTLDTTYTIPNTGKDLEGYAFAVVASSDSGRDSLIYQTPYGPYDDYLDELSTFDDWDNRADKIKVRVGNIEGADTNIASGTHGLYGESVRLTEDVLIGDLAENGSFLRFDSDGLKIVNRNGYEGAEDNSYSEAILQLEDDVRLLAENITQERESRASLELKANETEARFQADVRFEGATASVSLVANSDGSTARLAGDSIILDGDTTVNGSSFLNGDVLVDGTIDTNKITIADALTLQPGGAFYAGRGDTRFAFGDFGLSQQEKGTQNHDGLSAGAFASEGDNDTVTSSRTRSVSLDTADQWSMVARADYSTDTDGNASATASIKVIGRVNGAVVGQNVSSANTGSGRLEVIGTLDLSAYSGTVTVDVEVVVEGSANTTDESGFDSASADVGDFGNDANDPTSNVISNTDFFGTNGARWRKNGNDEIILNGRVFGGPKGTDPGDIWIAGELNAASVNDRSSDRRLKTDIQPIEDPLETVQQMEGKTFQYRGNESAGLIAQDAIGVFDEAVSTYTKDGEEYYALDQRAFVAPLTEAVKELDGYTQDHEARIAALERENEHLRSLIEQ